MGGREIEVGSVKWKGVMPFHFFEATWEKEMKIESTDQDIRTLLSSAYYKIPRFQRPYSWEEKMFKNFGMILFKVILETTSSAQWLYIKMEKDIGESLTDNKD
mgnify:CR=1 FL=1